MMIRFFGLLLYAAICQQVAAWPMYIDLNIGEDHHITLPDRYGEKHTCKLKLVSIDHEYAPNYWHRIPKEYQAKHLKSARLSLEVNGRKVELTKRPYQSPISVDGFRLYVEDTKRWAKEASFLAIESFPKDARIAVALDNESWGPSDMLFPIRSYRWGSSPYQNTWGSLVPYNSLYYHRGEDFGAIPDQLEVQAILEGTVMETPLPKGDGKSNAIVVRHDADFTYRVSHVNTTTVQKNIQKDVHIEDGGILAKTGNTYRRPGAQYRDPHLHIDFTYKGRPVSTFPFLIEAYFRDYPENLIAISGSYAYTMPGEEVALDATRSIVRTGHRIVDYTWKLHDGQIVNQAKHKLRYSRPGLYTEELIVRTDDGSEDRDFLQVRVFDNQNNESLAYGWAYHTPVRGLRPGQTVRFWNRLTGIKGDVSLDTGDGSSAKTIEKEYEYQYANPGTYTATFSGRGTDGHVVIVKMKIVVEE
ncbi:PKD domain-containing protein [Sphingobacterium chuzhouense]|uniref:Peptidoglycan DD-metalloendopeptidase family protein n=1 Tax=Sphingobacterium chuzhouense TaxID=1742264 RepID=A0ABR7XU93_9SPHI|nr:PKD domain-containing protein [Sphingobacterium chuzhouense]MBD1422609.1 peptidoglycan DD-metalloendopeptidase family protein [Sphingobacterium chuzhouense]